MSQREISIGNVYRHFKGGKYVVVALSQHTETGEELVTYQSYQDGKYYTRPKDMFLSVLPEERRPECKVQEQEFRMDLIDKSQVTKPKVLVNNYLANLVALRFPNTSHNLCVEELAELIKAISREYSFAPIENPIVIEKITEQVAYVYVMLEWIITRHQLNISKIQGFIADKECKVSNKLNNGYFR